MQRLVPNPARALSASAQSCAEIRRLHSGAEPILCEGCGRACHAGKMRTGVILILSVVPCLIAD
jgi:hypothetical protein